MQGLPTNVNEIRTQRGLYLQPNTFSVPDGALEEAENIVVRDDLTLGSRRGYYQYFTPLTGTYNNIFLYQNSLIAVYQDKIAYYTNTGTFPNQTGTETVLTGEAFTAVNNTSRSLQANSNFYWTTDDGVMKVSQFNGIVTFSGAPPGLDLELSYTQDLTANWFLAGNIVGYRILFGYVDGNQNTILGAPSQVALITNPNVMGLSYSSSGTTITVTSPSHGLANGDTMIFAGASDGSIDGQYAITYIDANTFSYISVANKTYTFTISSSSIQSGTIYSNNGSTFTVLFTTSSSTSIEAVSSSGAPSSSGTLTYLSGPTTGNVSYSAESNSGTGTLNYSFGMATLLEFSVPSVINTNFTWFYRVYRSSQQPLSNGGAIFDDFELIIQNNLSAGQYSSGIIFYQDNIPDLLRGLYLYTNSNSGQGELQANNQAPLCQDMCLFQNYAFYANCTTPQLLYINLIQASALSNGDSVTVQIDTTDRTYVAVTGAGNQVNLGSASSSTGLLITYNAHGFSDNWTVYIANAFGGTLTAGIYYVVSAATNTFKISLTMGGSPVAYPSGLKSLTFEAVTNGTNPVFFLSQTGDVAVDLTDTATGLVKAINRDKTSLIYAQYISGVSAVPGQMLFQSIEFTNPIFVKANSTAAGTAFFPNLPDSFLSGTQVQSQNNVLPNVLYLSKYGIPEAVPYVNFLQVGANNYPIYRVIALRDVVIIVKADGVYRLTGDNITNFTVTILDNTIFCVAPSSVTVLNNQVIFLSNQGVCLISESSVEIISRAKLEDEIQPILGQTNLASQTAAVGYETERLYLLTTTEPNTTTATVTWCYNILTNEWTSWDQLFSQSAIGPNDTMYYIGLDNNLFVERKTQTAYDFSDQNYDVTISSISADGTTGTITLATSAYFPKEGDMFVSNDVITWLDQDPILVTGNTYSCVFTPNNNLTAGLVTILYASFYHIITFSPYHAGMLSRMKLFSQFMVHLRNSSMTKAIITFSGYALGGSGQIIWASTLTAQGWGNPPWGFFGWGQENTINLTIGTAPAGVVRTYVPPYQARTTFIQAGIEHRKAGEALEIQAISYVVRPYAERVTR